VCTQCLHNIHPPTPFPHLLSTVLTLPGRTCSTLLFSGFVKEKEKVTFVLKIATQGVSLRHFHEYMYYSLNWFIFSIFLLSTLVPFLCFQQVFKFYNDSCIESTPTMFIFLVTFFYSLSRM
jgi:hypothetical protein